MCGRYTLIKLADLIKAFPWLQMPPELHSRYNIAPTQGVLAVTSARSPGVEGLHWGLIPRWAKDPAIGNRLINARAETLVEKPSFRESFRNRRCLIPADGFYEWRKEPGGEKTPMYIRLKSAALFAFAGLWDEWRGGGGEVIRSCTIITTTPNELVKPIHDRIPAILRQEDYGRWLGPEVHEVERLSALLTPYPSQEMEAFPVSSRVNSPAVDDSECTIRIDPFPASLF